MQCEESEEVVERNSSDLNVVDAALKEFGMLTERANSKSDEYIMREFPMRNDSSTSKLKINTKFVSNVSIGLKMKPVVAKVRYKPFPTKMIRHRTRSENNDNSNENDEFIQSVLDNCIQSVDEITQLKKAKSLESIVSENNHDSIDFNRMNFGNLPELEVVSDIIQNLRVVE